MSKEEFKQQMENIINWGKVRTDTVLGYVGITVGDTVSLAIFCIVAALSIFILLSLFFALVGSTGIFILIVLVVYLIYKFFDVKKKSYDGDDEG